MRILRLRRIVKLLRYWTAWRGEEKIATHGTLREELERSRRRPRSGRN